MLLSLQLPGRALRDLSCGQEVICGATSPPRIACQTANRLGDKRHNRSSSAVPSPAHEAKALPVLPLRFMAEGLRRSLRHVQSPPHQPVPARGMGTLVARVGSWSSLIFLEVSFRAPVQVLPSLPARRRGVWHRFLGHAGADGLCGPLRSQPSPGSEQERCFSLDTGAWFAPLAGEQGRGRGVRTKPKRCQVRWARKHGDPPPKHRLQPEPLQQDKRGLVPTAKSILPERGTAQEVARPPPAPRPSLATHPSPPSSDRAANRLRLSPGGPPLISVA